MPSSLKTSFIGALQASLSVLLTLSYGILAAKWGFIHDTSITDISELCVKIFLPALLVTNIGSQLSVDALPDYVPIFRTLPTLTLFTITTINRVLTLYRCSLGIRLRPCLNSNRAPHRKVSQAPCMDCPGDGIQQFYLPSTPPSNVPRCNWHPQVDCGRGCG